MLKSEATRPDLIFHKRGNLKPAFTPRALAWIVRARDELGMSWDGIGRTMGRTWHRPRTVGPGISGETIKKYYRIAKNQSL